MSRLRTAGLAATVLAVLVLLGSLVAGLRHPTAPAPDPVAAVVDGARLRVEVLNGAGVPGLARSVTRQLRRQNFDVVYFGNAPAALDSSVVVDRAGNLDAARRVAEALGIRSLRSEPDPTLFLDATVVLGRDRAPPAGAADAPLSEP